MQTGPLCKITDHVWNRYRIVSLIIRLLVGIVFIYAGSLKLMDPAAFAWNIYQYGLVPRNLINMVAIGLPALEVLAGIGFILTVRGSTAAVAGLLIMFVLVLGYALFNDLNVDCGCFSAGELGPEGLKKAIVRDMIMIAGISFVYWFREERNRGNGNIRSIDHKEDV